ncbi:hypothetical protein Xaut_3614 [Xanthobacter versatilis]|uniref:Uncharacterized protein n=1 Tax=Xanthobacter autotrophicus (strain ATCC BAA-1158 / Py2) TaxID=78245 RepID=A7ILE9_XANP2|nr:hypothetical protein Xaut_3614 [Xanthobacter autotrophicus Py2]
MSEFTPVTTIEDLMSLDTVEMVDGYWDGWHGAPEPGNNRSRAYWHGWRNGAADAGHREKDAHQMELARAFVAFRRRAA